MSGFLRQLRDSTSAYLRYRRDRIDVLVWMQESSLTDALIAEISKAKPHSLIIVASLFSGQFYAYQPPGISFRRRPLLSILSLTWMGPRMGYFFYPLLLVLAAPVMFLFYLWLGLRFRVSSVLIFDHQQAAIVGLLRRIGLFRRLVFWSGDWYPGNTLRTGIWSRLGNEVYFPLMDWVACKWSDLTINQTAFIAEARNQYWGRQIPQEQVGFEPPLIIKCKDASVRIQGRKILFLGVTRPDSGLDLLLRALPRVRERLGEVSLKIVGPVTPTVVELKKAAGKAGLSALLECVGVADYAAFEVLFSDCYCGGNLITDPNSFSCKAIPGKILDYFQYLLPVIVSPYVGPMADTIRERKLGLVVTPEIGVVASALIELYDKRSEYVQNIQTFIRTRSSTSFVQLLCPEISAK